MIKYENLNNYLLRELPEIKEIYEDEKEFWPDNIFVGHFMFGLVINTYIASLLSNLNEENKNALQKTFEALEKIATYGDSESKNIIRSTVCERLGDNPRLLEIARGFMGKNTLHLSNEIESYWKENE
ncbi:MAG: hypothetical protein U0Z75_04615 [Deinococcaceae bacterium]